MADQKQTAEKKDLNKDGFEKGVLVSPKELSEFKQAQRKKQK